jgi:hypothetical protein
MKDTVGFRLYNPKKIPVFYTIFNGNKIIGSATDSSEWVKWTGKIATGRTYKLKWQYYWAGEERYFEENIALLSKLMSTDIKGRCYCLSRPNRYYYRVNERLYGPASK